MNIIFWLLIIIGSILLWFTLTALYVLMMKCAVIMLKDKDEEVVDKLQDGLFKTNKLEDKTLKEREE